MLLFSHLFSLGARPGHNIQLFTKLKVYSAVVLTSVLFGCEAWTLYHQHIKHLMQFHMHALHSILGICQHGKITSLEILGRAEATSTEAMLFRAQLRLTGCVTKMEEQCVPHLLIYCSSWCPVSEAIGAHASNLGTPVKGT